MVYLTKNAKEILNDCYLLRDDKDNIVETSNQLFKRVSKFVATAESNNKSAWEKQLTPNQFIPSTGNKV